MITEEVKGKLSMKIMHKGQFVYGKANFLWTDFKRQEVDFIKRRRVFSVILVFLLFFGSLLCSDKVLASSFGIMGVAFDDLTGSGTGDDGQEAPSYDISGSEGKLEIIPEEGDFGEGPEDEEEWGNEDDGLSEIVIIGDEDEDEEEPVEIGTVLVSRKSKCAVKVTDTGEFPCVSYVGPTNEKAGVVLIPDTVDIDGIIYSVTSIEKRAFYRNKKIMSVTIGKNINLIGKEAFKGCSNLSVLEFKGELLSKVKKGAFKGTPKGLTVSAPKSVIISYKKLIQKTR